MSQFKTPFPAVSSAPQRPAYIMASTGETVTYQQLEDLSNQGAHLLREMGLKPGDHVAMLLENHARFLVVYWAAMRSGMYVTPVSTHLSAPEAAYIINDCGARVLISSGAMKRIAVDLPALTPSVEHYLTVDAPMPGFDNWMTRIEPQPKTPIADQVAGQHMFYSSGTTGKPKGIKTDFANAEVDSILPLAKSFSKRFGFDGDTVYLSPAPLYHAGPLGYCSQVFRAGGTIVVVGRFDPEDFLQFVEKYRITHTQVVPTMFVRMLKLPQDIREKYYTSSMKVAIHAAAPCPVAVKEQMMEWWGPVLYEYYGGSEGNGMTIINPDEWMQNKGSVGRPIMGELKILGEEGEELAPGETGYVYFANTRTFQYHNDPDKTREAINDKGWSTLGDVGYVNDGGYLFLTDRKSYMIISGGVNIYPQEAENVLTMHPKVFDVAVLGVPNPDFGEEVKAVVQPVNWEDAGPALEAELIEYCRSQIAAIKCPRSVDFDANLPRQDNGKLLKRLLRDRYWKGPSKIAG